HLTETPLREDSLARSDWQERAARDLGHYVVILRLARLFDEHRLIRLDSLDQQLSRCRADCSVKINRQVDIISHSVPQLGEFLGGILHRCGRFNIARRPLFGRSGFEGRETAGQLPLYCLRSAGMGIDTDAVARRAAEQLIDWNTEGFSLDIPERLVDAAERAGQDRSAAVKRMPVDRLPMMRDPARVLANQV